MNVTLINNLVPAVGNTFTISTCSARTGQFATVNCLSISGGEHFEISYNPMSVTLTVPPAHSRLVDARMPPDV